MMIIKQAISVVSTFLQRLYLRNSLIIKNRGQLFLCKIKMGGGNLLISNASRLARTIIQLNDSKNSQLSCEESEIYKSSITVLGNRNRIEFSKGCKIGNMTMLIKGDNCSIKFGKDVSVNGATLICMGKNNYIRIGNECMLSDNIQIWNTDSHPILNDEEKIINPSKPISIGDKVWIGKNVSILKGVTIGNGSIIGMGSIVTKDLPSNYLCVGNPAKAIKAIGGWRREHINC